MIKFQHGPIVLTENWSDSVPWTNKKFKKIDMTNLKMREINFKGWYCPIDKFIFMINWDGSIYSGICANVVHTTSQEPWWGLSKLNIDINIHNPGGGDYCKRKKGDCVCDADIYMPKAINRDVYNWVLENNPIPLSQNQESLLPIATDEDNIIAIAGSSKADRFESETHFHIGKRCNFNCSYCSPIWVHDNYSPDMSMQHFKHALDLVEPYMYKSKKLFITGGEPTLNPKLFNMVKYAKDDLNYEVYVSTNGTASLTKITNLLKYGINLQISMHVEFTKEILIRKIATLMRDVVYMEKYQDQIQVKVMSLPDTEFAQYIDSILPEWIDIHHYPIYELDQGGAFSNIQVQPFTEMKEQKNVRIN